MIRPQDYKTTRLQDYKSISRDVTYYTDENKHNVIGAS